MEDCDDYKNMSEPLLFRCIRSGDEAAFTYVYRKYAPALLLFCLRYLRNEKDAEDAVQHVFLKLWDKRSELTISASLKDYLYASAKNLVLNHLRRELTVRAKHEEIYRSGAPAGESAEEALLRSEVHTQLEAATLSLPAVKQQIVLLRREGLSNKEISARLSIPENTVKTYYAQSLKFLREHFKKILVLVISFFANCLS